MGEKEEMETQINQLIGKIGGDVWAWSCYQERLIPYAKAMIVARDALDRLCFSQCCHSCVNKDLGQDAYVELVEVIGSNGKIKQGPTESSR